MLNHGSNASIVVVQAHAQSSFKSIESSPVDNIEQRSLVAEPGDLESERKSAHKRISRENPERIALWQDDRITLVSITSISCCFVQKGRRKVTVVAANKIYESNYTFTEFLEKIGNRKLVRCHRSFAINPDYLSELLPGGNNTMIAKVAGHSIEIPVSRQYSPVLRTIAGLRTRTDCKKQYCAH